MTLFPFSPALSRLVPEAVLNLEAQVVGLELHGAGLGVGGVVVVDQEDVAQG